MHLRESLNRCSTHTHARMLTLSRSCNHPICRGGGSVTNHVDTLSRANVRRTTNGCRSPVDPENAVGCSAGGGGRADIGKPSVHMPSTRSAQGLPSVAAADCDRTRVATRRCFLSPGPYNGNHPQRSPTARARCACVTLRAPFSARERGIEELCERTPPPLFLW
jgi:hypothetical protein